MTPEQWASCDEPQRMLDTLEHTASERKLRRFAATCCRRIERYLDDRCRAAVGTAERFADGDATLGELLAAICDARDSDNELDHPLESGALAVWCACENEHVFIHTTQAADNAVWMELGGDPTADEAAHRLLVETEQAALMREMFNPFAPIVDPAWLIFADGLIPALAHAIYDDRAFDRMPILGDALEDAGCVDRTVLDHCRGNSPHVRGCWVLDLLTGRS